MDSLPHSSVAVNKRSMLYSLAHVPGITVSTTDIATFPQLSVASGMSVGISSEQSRLRSAKATITGASLSITVISCWPVAVFKHGSIAENVRTMV